MPITESTGNFGKPIRRIRLPEPPEESTSAVPVLEQPELQPVFPQTVEKTTDANTGQRGESTTQTVVTLRAAPIAPVAPIQPAAAPIQRAAEPRRDLNFKVEESFARSFKQAAALSDLAMVEVLKEAFSLWIASKPEISRKLSG